MDEKRFYEDDVEKCNNMIDEMWYSEEEMKKVSAWVFFLIPSNLKTGMQMV